MTNYGYFHNENKNFRDLSKRIRDTETEDIWEPCYYIPKARPSRVCYEPGRKNPNGVEVTDIRPALLDSDWSFSYSSVRAVKRIEQEKMARTANPEETMRLHKEREKQYVRVGDHAIGLFVVRKEYDRPYFSTIPLGVKPPSAFVGDQKTPTNQLSCS